MSFEKIKGKEHLDKDFLEELKHKIWSTKGARFGADNRLKTTARYSSLGNSILSAYIIIFGLISVYNLSNVSSISDNLTAFSLTALSVISLIFSLVDNGSNYLLKAKDFHDCALELSELYNELQIFKTYSEGATKEEIRKFVIELQHRYQFVLEKYDNHLPIDNEYFRAKHHDYYSSVTRTDRFYAHLKLFAMTKLLYIIMIFFLH
ncbi:hypothetical protein HYN48_09575 [Flavobacterium magnum]|uniref:SMODS and SLOG-associating 2TM effector domain-containing protein n=1 Tax=Flavobacterium magnum TaxID=2162713 RepID=A0A2S0RF86_9FLAO|nr:SLATT domain-containing protein [Flavobacterium magnum]AWA30314.1 hypothetical protein HYN48_09575 [Flavobacterium magnum]